MKPFLKWAGGKRWLIPKIADRLPAYDVYYETFLGSGTLFFALEPKKAVLSDSNRELINCYRRIKYNCKDVIKILKKLRVSKKDYYQIRDKFNREEDPVKRAVYFIYINHTAWNGLYRVNQYGEFNVPIGTIKKKHPVYDENHLIAVSRLLKRATIKCCDFEYTSENAKRGDLVYFDPPYITTHSTNGFIKYNQKLFHQADELRLAAHIYKLAMRDVYVLLSNAAHPLIKQQYNGMFNKMEISRRSTIAADSANRRSFKELLVTNFDF